MLVSEVSDLSLWNLKGPHPFSLSPDSASEPRLLARPRLSSSFFRNLKLQTNMKLRNKVKLRLKRVSNSNLRSWYPYLFLDCFLFSRSWLSSSSQLSVSPSSMGGILTLRLQGIFLRIRTNHIRRRRTTKLDGGFPDIDYIEVWIMRK